MFSMSWWVAIFPQTDLSDSLGHNVTRTVNAAMTHATDRGRRALNHFAETRARLVAQRQREIRTPE